MTLLAQDRLDVSVFPPKGCQLFLRHFDVLAARVQTVPFAQFFGQQLQFAFRTPSEFRVGTITGAPAAINVGISYAHVERVVTHLDPGSFNGWITHGLTPILQVIDSHADTRLHLCGSFSGRWKGGLEESIVILDRLVETLSIARK